MLQLLRKKAQSTFIQIIVVIIALVFIFWGVGANLNGNRQAALVVNDEEISFQQFQQAYDRAYQQLSDQFGGNVPKGLAETFGIKQQVIKQLVQTSLLRQGAAEMGIQVSAQEIRQAIEEMVQFQDNGVFSIERYKTVLAANRMAPTKFEKSMGVDRLSEVAAREISNFASTTTDFEIEEIYSQLNETIALKYVKFSPDQFLDQVTTEDDALKSWFATVQENYKTEPQIKLKYLAFTFDQVGQKIEIDKGKIEEYYQNNIDSYRVPEQRHARHILLAASDKDSAQIHEEKAKKAEEVLQLVKNGDDFKKLAETYSEGPSKSNGGDLGFFSAGQMVPAFDEAVFAMQPGDISDVVKTDFGYHIIQLEDIKPAASRPLPEVTAEITKTLQRKEADILAFQMANDAYEGIIGAGSLSKFSETNGEMQIQDTDFFPRSAAPADLRQDSLFLDKAFELNKGELSSLVKGQSGYAVLFAEDIKEPEIPNFETIRKRLVLDYQKAKAKEIAETAAKELLSNLREGKELEVIGQEKNFTILESGFLSKNSPNQNEGFPSALVQAGFQLSQSSPLPKEPGQVGEDYFVFSFLDRQTPSMPDDQEEVQKYQENLLRFKQQQLLAAWLRHLEIDAEITQHQSL